MTTEDFRQLALALPSAEESAHMNHPDFRVRGKIFATLWPAEGHGVLMLTPEQQQAALKSEATTLAPVPGGWGRKGATIVYLEHANESSLCAMLEMAWRNKAPKSEKRK